MAAYPIGSLPFGDTGSSEDGAGYFGTENNSLRGNTGGRGSDAHIGLPDFDWGLMDGFDPIDPDEAECHDLVAALSSGPSHFPAATPAIERPLSGEFSDGVEEDDEAFMQPAPLPVPPAPLLLPMPLALPPPLALPAPVLVPHPATSPAHPATPISASPTSPT